MQTVRINLAHNTVYRAILLILLMSKGSKEALTVLLLLMLLMSKGSKVVFVAYIHKIDTFNAMSKWSKDYVILKQGTNTFLLITFLMLNRFSNPEKVWKTETWTFPTIPSNAMYVKTC